MKQTERLALDDELAITAHHEAGHAVAALMEGVELLWAEVGQHRAPDGLFYGQVCAAGNGYSSLSASRVCFVAYAGWAADNRYRAEHGFDRACIYGSTDWEWVKGNDFDRQYLPGKADADRQWGKDRADDLVQTEWPAIQAVADAIVAYPLLGEPPHTYRRLRATKILDALVPVRGQIRDYTLGCIVMERLDKLQRIDSNLR